jgi:hypothetical protein
MRICGFVAGDLTPTACRGKFFKSGAQTLPANVEKDNSDKNKLFVLFV